MSSVLDEKDDDQIRCCQHCKDTLLKREQQIDEKEYTPEIVKLYEVNQTPCLFSHPSSLWLNILIAKINLKVAFRGHILFTSCDGLKPCSNFPFCSHLELMVLRCPLNIVNNVNWDLTEPFF